MDILTNYKIMIPILVICLVIIIIGEIFLSRYFKWSRRVKMFMLKFELKDSRELERVKRKYSVKTFDELSEIVERRGIQTLAELDESLFHEHEGEQAIWDKAILNYCREQGVNFDESLIDEIEKNYAETLSRYNISDVEIINDSVSDEIEKNYNSPKIRDENSTKEKVD